MAPQFSEAEALQFLEANYDDLERWAVEAYQFLHEKRVTQNQLVTYTDDDPEGRFIGMACVIKGKYAGLKWISSFTENIDMGFERGDATLILSNVTRETSGQANQKLGRTLATFEAEAITRYRTVTGAIAVLRHLRNDLAEAPLCLIGCGALHHILAEYWIRKVGLPREWRLCDERPGQVERLKQRILELSQKWHPGYQPHILPYGKKEVAEAMHGQSLVSFGTTVKEPHIDSLEGLQENATLLNFSLRDLSVPCMLKAAHHIADDKELTARADQRTSLAWAVKETASAANIQPKLDLAGIEEYGDILFAPSPKVRTGLVILSPFGLPCLDVWFAGKIFEQAKQKTIIG